ncbi:MAG: DapH/DapD/GlmU-related protein [Pseudomonadota bacterium]
MTKLSIEPLIHETAHVEASTIGRYTEVGEQCRIVETEFGDYSYMMRAGDIWGSTIGKFANIASFVRINATNHPTWRVTQHHFTYRAGDYFDDAENEEEFFEWRRDNAVTIGHDTWIGHGATVLPGVTVGNGAVIGSGAVVSKNVDPYTVIGGVPAVPLKRRLPVAVCERMEALAWWDWDHAALRAALHDFKTLSPEAFLERYE